MVFVECTGAIQRRIKPSADGEHAIADYFGFEALWRASPEPDIFGIEPGIRGIKTAALHVGSRSHDELVQWFEPPAIANQFAGEPIEQFRMRRLCALDAEIVDGLGDAAA